MGSRLMLMMAVMPIVMVVIITIVLTAISLVKRIGVMEVYIIVYYDTIGGSWDNDRVDDLDGDGKEEDGRCW